MIYYKNAGFRLVNSLSFEWQVIYYKIAGLRVVNIFIIWMTGELLQKCWL